MSDFLPKGYEVPKSSSRYMKFKTGANKFRILSSPAVLGYEYWTEDRKPVRAKKLWETIPLDADISGKKGWDPKHFWAFVVWNFQTKKIEILSITQATVQGPMQDLIESEEYGDPRGYSITVTKKGENLETEYTVMPSPPQETPAEILKAVKAEKIDLEQLFTGGNPFSPSEAKDEPVEPEVKEEDIPF